MLKLIRRLREKNSKKALRILEALRPAAFNRPNNFANIGSTRKIFRENANLQASLVGQKRGPLGRTHFMAACARGDVERVRELKDLAAPSKIIDVQDNHGKTALVYAILNDHNDIVDILLNEGKYQANPNLADNFEYTPLEEAIEVNNLEALKLLIKKGVDVNAHDPAGFTPLMMAVSFENVDASRILIENGAKVNAINENGASALYYASEEGYIEVVRLLLDAGAKVDLANDDGTTPLMISVIEGHGENYDVKKDYREVIILLLDNGAKRELAIPLAQNFRMKALLKHYIPKKGGSRNKTKRLKQRK